MNRIRKYGCNLDIRGQNGNWDASEILGTLRDIKLATECNFSGLLDGHISDQGNTSSCVGHGLARGIQLRARRLGNETYPLPSAIGIYAIARAEQHGHSTEGLVDDGTTIGAAVSAVAERGFCSETDLPFEEHRVTTPLRWGELRACYDQHTLLGYRIQSPTRNDYRLALGSVGLGVVIGMDCDEDFENLGQHDVWTGLRGPRLGGHCMACLDFDAAGVRVVNSWGSQWGNNGLARLSWDFMLSECVRSVWFLDVMPPPPLGC